jgi:hypothetical protein
MPIFNLQQDSNGENEIDSPVMSLIRKVWNFIVERGWDGSER